MRISVVIPLYNKAADVEMTLQSVVEQTFAPYEVIVVDDGSTDDSAQVVEEFIVNNSLNIREKPDIYLIRKSNGGVCSARNTGIREAQGEYVALLDADDVWDKEYLQEQAKMIKDFPEAGMWGVNFAEMYNGKLIRTLKTGLPDGFRGYVEDYFKIPDRQSDLFCSSSVVIDKSVFRKAGLFDERIRYAEDLDMWFRIIVTSRVAFYDRYMVYYRYDAQNRAMNKPRQLKYYLPSFIDKYKTPPYSTHRDFYRWIMHWSAVCTKRVYFSDVSQKDDAVAVVKKLDYSVLPVKYRFFFKLPYPIAKMLYLWDEKRRKHG